MLHVAIDVRVVELHAGEHRGAGPVVHEFRALVEVRGVVFIALHDDERPVPIPEVPVVVHGHAANEKAWVGARVDEHMGHEGGCGRLAVRARDHHAVLVGEHQRPEGGGKAHLGNTALPNGGGFHVHAPDDVADDHEVRFRRVDVRRRVRRHRLHAPLRQHVAHRGIDAFVAPRDLVSRGLEHSGKGAHAGSGNAHEVNAPDGTGRDVAQDVAVVVGHSVGAVRVRVSRPVHPPATVRIPCLGARRCGYRRRRPRASCGFGRR